MISEISDTTSIEFDNEISSFEPVRGAPKGLSAIPDTMDALPKAPKPHLIKRIILSIGLLIVHGTTLTLRFCHWAFEKLTGPSRAKVLYQHLHHIAKKRDPAEIQAFLLKHSEENHAAGYLFKELLKLPEIHPFLAEILKGANVSLSNDRGFLFRSWKEHPEAYQRISSHEYQEDECYAIGHVLFWLDQSGHTRFQFENSPLKGFFSAINHVIDYLRYKRDNEQQGVMGSSAYTEDYCLTFEVDPKNYLTTFSQASI